MFYIIIFLLITTVLILGNLFILSNHINSVNKEIDTMFEELSKVQKDFIDKVDQKYKSR